MAVTKCCCIITAGSLNLSEVLLVTELTRLSTCAPDRDDAEFIHNEEGW
jgi:hypothetical protein